MHARAPVCVPLDSKEQEAGNGTAVSISKSNRGSVSQRGRVATKQVYFSNMPHPPPQKKTKYFYFCLCLCFCFFSQWFQRLLNIEYLYARMFCMFPALEDLSLRSLRPAGPLRQDLVPRAAPRTALGRAPNLPAGRASRVRAPRGFATLR